MLYNCKIRRLLLYLTLFAGMAHALGAATIGSVAVQSDVQVADMSNLEQLVLSNMKSRPGTEFSRQVLNDDIKRLYGTGHFDDIRTAVDRTPDGTEIAIVVGVTPKPNLRSIIIEGNRKVKTKTLMSLIEHELGVPVDGTQLATDAEAIRGKYHDKGYHQVQVNMERKIISATREVDVVFNIDERLRHKIAGVTLRGNSKFTSKELKKKMRTRRRWWNRILPWGNYFNQQELAVDKAVLRDYYTSRGYLDFQIVGVEKQLDAKGESIRITLTLSEGTQYTVSSVSIAGNNRFTSGELNEQVKLQPDEVYNSRTENSDVGRLKAKYENLGYLDVQCYPAHDIDSSNSTVAVEYRIREGLPCTIRDIYLNGNNVTKSHVIRRELALHPGDVGDASRIRASKARLENLNYFKEVSITPQSTENPNQKNLSIQVTEKRTGQLMVGAGFSSEDAGIAFVEVTQSNFDWRDWPRFRGGGQRLRLRTQLGTERSDFILSFTEPWWLNKRLRLDLDLFNRARYEDQYDRETIGLGAMVTRRWRKYWRQGAGIRIQNIKLEDFESDTTRELLKEEGSYNASRIILRITRDSRDRYINPTRGSQLMLTTEFVPGFLGSYADICRAILGGTKYFPVFSKTVLKLDSEVAFAWKLSNDDVAIFDRFFAGGTNSIRGFERREVSPVDDAEEPLGGKARLLAGAELIHPFNKTVSGTLFCDTGNVWKSTGDINPGEINASVGVGLQLNLPVGPIRLNYGWPIVTDQKHLEGSNGRLHFNLGYSF